MTPFFRNRAEAGRILAAHLQGYKDRPDVLVLALPRGGVPVAYEVAQALRAPLDVFVVRKVGVPWHPELAMGAIASGGILILNDDVIQTLGIPESALRERLEQERGELTRRERLYRGGRPAPALCGRTVIVVDDGLATGSTMQAAVAALRQQQPARIVIAVPVGSAEICAVFRGTADETVCARTPQPFHGVGQWYEDFSQTTDQEVHDLLATAACEREQTRASA